VVVVAIANNLGEERYVFASSQVEAAELISQSRRYKEGEEEVKAHQYELELDSLEVVPCINVHQQDNKQRRQGAKPTAQERDPYSPFPLCTLVSHRLSAHNQAMPLKPS
jgi:hypothetical protein